ncbi:flagellar assembly protein FliX [Hirschia litorea]|uniref:Flagellar assembly protein FliX n=1 Tax=Hirschia litorea TaxID=1199156 RepID=A0ABW2ILS8_9PROT
MRVSRPVSAKPAAGVSKTNTSKSAGFSNLVSSTNSASSSEHTAPNAASGSVGGISGVESIMALQALDNSSERRNKAMRKGRRMLDALDRLQISVLDGQTSTAHLGLLRRALSDMRDATGDDGLDNALSHIEVRTAVEIAKLERQQKEML